MLPVFIPERETEAAPPSRPSRRADTERTRKRRVLTDARKEQNRVAQRAFRQRQKERKEELASKAAQPAPNPPLRPRPKANSAASSSPGGTNSISDKSAPESWGDALRLLEENVSDGLATSRSDPGPIWDIANTDASSSPLTLSQHVDKAQPSTALSIASGSHLPDPCANAIRLLPTTMFSAILHNAIVLGFDPFELAKCAADAHQPSPFFRPSTPQDDPSALLASVHLSLPPGVPEHLKPTLAQVLVPHHTCLDLIPVPVLRERAIMLSAAMPFAYNLYELKLDIYERHGLTVWAHEQRGGSAVDTYTGSGCQPWDMRNWEAAPWFLKKWSMAIDGEGGELSRQSAWFRSLRSGSVSELS